MGNQRIAFSVHYSVRVREPGEAVGTGLAGTKMPVLGVPLSRGRRTMILLELGESRKMEPLKKSPLVLRLFLTSAAILAVFAVMIGLQTGFQVIDKSCAGDVCWDLTTMWH